jgi:hypothetical protein
MAKIQSLPEHMEILEHVIEEEDAAATAQDIAEYLVSLMNDVGDVLKDRPYLANAVLRGFPGQIQYHLRGKEKAAAKASDYGKYLARANDGTEISDSKLQRQAEFVRSLVNDLNELDGILEAVIENYNVWADSLSGENENGSAREFSHFGSTSSFDKGNTLANKEFSEASAKLDKRLAKNKRSR